VKKPYFLVVLLGMLILGLACSEKDKTTTPTTTDEFEIIRIAVNSYTADASTSPTSLAADLYANLNDGDSTNNPYILSVRSNAHYQIGHIPGAHNVFWRDIGDSGATADLPMDKQIVVYCYTGHTGGIATTILQAMGYNAINLKHGICSWTRDASVRSTTPFVDAVDSHDYPLETTANTPAATNALPAPDYTSSTDTAEIIRAASEAYAGNTSKLPTISAADLYANLNDGDSTNNPIILSVRSASHYALGHIPGAINIPWREICDVNKLKMLPTDKQIVVYCYTGHTGAIATTALNLMGYNAINLKYGICSWTRDTAVRATQAYDDAIDAHDYPCETGP